MVSTPMTNPSPTIDAVVIGGSAGSVTALGEILPGLPADFPPVLVVVHIPASSPSLLVAVFAPRCSMIMREAESGGAIERGTVYFAPSDYHLLVESDRRCALSIEPPIHFSRPAIDPLFESAAYVYGSRLAGLVLTGASKDGALGLFAIHRAGGIAMVQDPAVAETPAMPLAAIAAVPTARVVTLSRALHQLRLIGAPT
jgi:two-component system chemotaxis response regulator CheB